MSELNTEQIAILEHTKNNQFFCGASEDMDELIALGFMVFAGRKSFVPDPYYAITGKGRAALQENNDE